MKGKELEALKGREDRLVEQIRELIKSQIDDDLLDGYRRARAYTAERGGEIAIKVECECNRDREA